MEGSVERTKPKSDQLDSEIREIAFDLVVEKILAETGTTKSQGAKDAFQHHRQSVVGKKTPGK